MKRRRKKKGPRYTAIVLEIGQLSPREVAEKEAEEAAAAAEAERIARITRRDAITAVSKDGNRYAIKWRGRKIAKAKAWPRFRIRLTSTLSGGVKMGRLIRILDTWKEKGPEDIGSGKGLGKIQGKSWMEFAKVREWIAPRKYLAKMLGEAGALVIAMNEQVKKDKEEI